MIFLNVTAEQKRLPYYLYGGAVNYNQKKVERLNGCLWFQLNICKKGRGYLKMNGKECYIEEGDSLIIYPNVPHEYYPVDGTMIVSWIAFDGFQVNSMFKSIGIETSGIYRLADDDDIHSAVKNIMAIDNIAFTEQSYRGSQLVYNFLLILMKNFRVDDSQKNDFSREKLKPAIDYMNKNLANPIGIEEIADTLNITSQHFCLLFKSIMNQRPFEYLNSLRINHSKNLLIYKPEYSISEVSLLSGYSNPSYYCQLFKKSERLTPASFKQRYRQNVN